VQRLVNAGSLMCIPSTLASILVGYSSLDKTQRNLRDPVRKCYPDLFNYGMVMVFAGSLLFFRYLKFFRQYSYELFNTYGAG